jgi:hypothetical protein
VTPLLVGLVVAVILASAGGFIIWQKLAAHGGQPESAVPTTAVAYAEIDLDPSADQKLKVRDQLRKIPGVKDKLSADGTNLKEELLKGVLDNMPIVDYDSDIKPWLGDRAAVALIPGKSGKPEVLVLLQHKDKSKAETAMRKLFGMMSMGQSAMSSSTTTGITTDAISTGSSAPKAYAVGDEYIVMGSSQAVVDAAVASAKDSNLGSAKTYTSDIGTLGNGQIVTVWADLGAVYALAGADSPMMPLGLSALGGKNPGRYVLGVHAFADGFEMTGRVIGSELTSGDIPGRSAAALADLPNNTAAAIYVGNPGPQVAAAYESMKASLPAEQLQSMTDEMSKLGISIPSDVADLLGTDALAAMAPVDPMTGGSPQFGVRVTPKDAQHSLDLLQKVAAQQPDVASVLDGVKTDGKDLVWTTPGDFGAGFASGKGSLGGTDHFKKALDLKGDVLFAAYVDSSATGSTFSPTGALGVTVTKDGKDSAFTLRVVID